MLQILGWLQTQILHWKNELALVMTGEEIWYGLKFTKKLFIIRSVFFFSDASDCLFFISFTGYMLIFFHAIHKIFLYQFFLSTLSLPRFELRRHLNISWRSQLELSPALPGAHPAQTLLPHSIVFTHIQISSRAKSINLSFRYKLAIVFFF